MEDIVSPQSQKHNLQASARRISSSRSQKDLWLVVQEGSVTDVDLALSLLKKNGGNINARNMFGVTPLHIATWRNHIPIVKRLLAAGADPNARDGESGWSSLHRALHFGHLAVASVLIQSGASTTLEDSKNRTPVDLISGPVMQAIGNGESSVDTEVFSWGSGVNYQLGTGNAHIQKLPCKVDSLYGSFIKLIDAAKFHSVAVTSRGEVYTWGFGRGGRLGHPEFDIHSGQAAVITPRLVTTGLGARRVKAIAAAKHHTVVATESGDVFTWGSNREGQLGYTSVDSQPTPRRVSSLRSKIVSVAAANKHTAVLSECGEVFTWGCNKEGQLGYGTSNSASNYTPRVVESLKGKSLVGVAAAKYHTIVLGADGEVFTWGHRLVTPRRVIVARNIKKGGNSLLKFHRKERLHVVSVAAGMVHSLALTEDGALFYWVSSDPDLRCQQLYSVCGRTIVSVSAGKYWTAAVTATGDVYTFDGKKGKDEPLVATRLHGAKKATSVSVGETHLLLVGSLYHPVYPCSKVSCPPKLKQSVVNEVDELDEDFMFSNVECDKNSPTLQEGDIERRAAPTLKSLCEKVAAEFLVEPRNVMQLLEIADSLEADDLRKYCEDIALRNLDYILTVSAQTISGASLDVLVNLEKLLDLRSSESWSHRRLPTPTATFPVIIHSEEEDSESELLRTRNTKPTLKSERGHRLDCFLQVNNDANEVSKRLRVLRKKLQQIEMLEERQSRGQILDAQQIAKLHTRPALEYALSELGAPVESVQSKASSPTSTEGRGSKKADASKKQRRKSRQSVSQVAEEDVDSVIHLEPNPQKESQDIHIRQALQKKDEEAELKTKEASKDSEESTFCIKKGLEDNLPAKGSLRATSKKKNKKGGLSMFLSGALDDTPQKSPPSPQPPTPKSEGPAWGGAKIAKGSASLRVIQDEQSKTPEGQRSRIKEQVGDASDSKSVGKIPLSSFMSSKPIAVVPVKASQVPDGEKNTPPWAASGTPPLLSRPSLRDIQMQQVKHHASLSHSPKASTTGFSIPTSQGSPSDAAGLNKWFKPEVDAPSSIRSIQIEEKAIKDLKRFYSSVKIVKNQS